MANVFLDAQQYANSFLLLLKNQLVMGRLVNTRYTNQVTDKNGLTISVKRPPQFIAQDGPALAEQDIVTGSETVRVDQYKNVHVSVTDLQAIQSYDQLLRSETMKSAASTLAHAVESNLQNRLLEFPSWVGTPGEFIKNPQQFNKAHTRLMNQSVPNSSLNAAVTFDDGELIRGALIGTDIDGINRSALQRVRIPIMSEINVYAAQGIPVLTTGSRDSSGGPLVDGAGQNVNYRDVATNRHGSQTLNLEGVGNNATISRGDVFTIAGVFAYDARRQQALEYLQQFTVMEDVTADGDGDVTVTISPAIIVPGTSDGVGTVTNSAFATVSAVPANDAEVTFVGAPSTNYRTPAAFHKQAITLVSAKLETPGSDTWSFANDEETGISIRYWRGSDIRTGEHIHRWDMVFGSETMDVRLGTRISGEPLA